MAETQPKPLPKTGRNGRPPARRRRLAELIAIFEETAQNKGIELDLLQQELCKRAASLSFECEETERRQARGETIDASAYGILCGQLNRMLTRIGLGTKPVIDPDSDTDPDRPYWENWKEDPKWWQDLDRKMGRKPKDYYSLGVPNYDNVFPDYSKHIIESPWPNQCAPWWMSMYQEEWPEDWERRRAEGDISDPWEGEELERKKAILASNSHRPASKTASKSNGVRAVIEQRIDRHRYRVAHRHRARGCHPGRSGGCRAETVCDRLPYHARIF